jgi:phosphate transport system substrate-binding protein
MTMMSRLAGVALAGTLMLSAAMPAKADTRLIGAGASFPFPIYSSWFKDFSKNYKDATIDYQAKGSGAGIQDFINRTVDFAASDAAMTDEDLAKVPSGAVLLPMTAGEIVIAYNLPGNPQLKLPRDVYPAIFAGEITRWNDPKIAEANPDIKLPDTPITVVRRSDSSGTTFVFTQHLAEVSPSFRENVGVGTTVQWPKSDKFVAAPKNDGVTATIKQTPGAIGYIEYGFAKLTKSPSAMLENKAGTFVAAGGEAGAAALSEAEFDENLIAWVKDPKGADAYPITTFTWMMFYKDQDDKKAAALRDMVEYGLTEGQKIADQMGYVPLPENVVAKIRDAKQAIQ